VAGTVQGVGFRPFVHALAHRHGLAGFVRNDGSDIVIEAEGDSGALEQFSRALAREAPTLASVAAVAAAPLEPRGERGFAIAPSRAAATAARMPVPPDVATCDECLAEVFDPRDRRHRYPFITCTQCGPRFTITRTIPYDRLNTTMAPFEMCAACRREYEDPSGRRFHAEAIACPTCGPALSMPLERAAVLLGEGAIVAVKGLGGYHLACDASDEAAVRRLRERKARDEKPFAVMSAAPLALAHVGAAEARLLHSRARPIVLLARRTDAPIAPSVAPGTAWLGVMLPYTPLHHLLAHDFGGALVMTSGNRSDEPIAFEDDDARARLGAVADAFLAHDRPIHRRCEDSVVRASFPLRRSRGFAPAPVPLPIAAPAPLIAAGAELKSTFCVARGQEAFLSPHLGDLDSWLAQRSFGADLRLYLEMLGLEPRAVAHDLHPGYHATSWAQERDAQLLGVQHHHAHAAACLAEHGERGPALGVVFDGTGYGPDGTLWGGEVLRFDLRSYERVAHLAPVPLPGGEAAIREPWRVAAMYLEALGRPVPFERWTLVRQSLAVNAPRSSGMGRLFDAIAALLGVRERTSYEGQAAAELEQLAGDTRADPYECAMDAGVIRGADLVGAAHDDLLAGRDRAEIAAAFHEGVALATTRACLHAREPRTVVLSGGTFQNLRLAGSIRGRLERAGFRVLTHRAVPPNDGGISYGQAAIAASRLAACA
jgi:hydrogenase maturation protein HypF